MTAKGYHLNDKVEGKENGFKFDYLKRAYDSLELSDGELEIPAKP